MKQLVWQIASGAVFGHSLLCFFAQRYLPLRSQSQEVPAKAPGKSAEIYHAFSSFFLELQKFSILVGETISTRFFSNL